jgi:hypothetical protein
VFSHNFTRGRCSNVCSLQLIILDSNQLSDDPKDRNFGHDVFHFFLSCIDVD